jgi:uncharacterized protein YdaU (DUF1376 family)
MADDLRTFPYMPLYISRLQRSKAWLSCKREPELAFYMINLWMRSWHEVPSGTLEDDDDVLADAAMCDLKVWARVKAKVMRGWVKTENGRLSHPVVAEVADASLNWKQKQRQRTKPAREAARLARAQKADKPATDTVTDSSHTSVTDDNRIELNRKGIEEKGREGSGLRPAPASLDVRPADVRTALWRDGVKHVRDLMGLPEKSARGFIGVLLKSAKDDASVVYAVLHDAGDLRPADPRAWITASVTRRAAGRPPGRHTEAMNGLMEAVHGPPDDHAGPTIDLSLDDSHAS